jgi:hypothetical protein
MTHANRRKNYGIYSFKLKLLLNQITQPVRACTTGFFTLNFYKGNYYENECQRIKKMAVFFD